MNYRLDFQDPERTYFRLRTRQKLPGPKRTRIIPAWYTACSGQARSPAVDPSRKAPSCVPGNPEFLAPKCSRAAGGSRLRRRLRACRRSALAISCDHYSWLRGALHVHAIM